MEKGELTTQEIFNSSNEDKFVLRGMNEWDDNIRRDRYMVDSTCEDMLTNECKQKNLAYHRTFKGEPLMEELNRLNLPFVGLCTFCKAPVHYQWEQIDADVAVLGAPFDMGTQYRSGARLGPRAIREASTLYALGPAGVYDHEDETIYLSNVRIVDAGDADIIHTDSMQSLTNIQNAVETILKSGALPVILGGDHSITAPNVAAFARQDPLHVIQFDAHLDFVDERYGVRYGQGNPMRRCSEMRHVSGITQLGIHGVGSSSISDFADAHAAGSTILSVRQIRKLGINETLSKIPNSRRFYITIDIDCFDPSIAPGTGTPSHGGFLYYEVAELLRGITKKGNVVGMDLVEVAPIYDSSGITSMLAVRVILDLIGYIFEERRKNPKPPAGSYP